MKSIFCINLIILLTCAMNVSAQRNADWGITAGASNYIGEINPQDLSRNPSVAGAMFFRYNIHPRHSIRVSLMGLGIRSDGDIPGAHSMNGNEASFSGFVGEMTGIFEFNFFPYSTEGSGRKIVSSPYLACGAGVAFVSTAGTFTPVIPFSVGYKVNFHKNMGLEFEYGFRKTFYDNFDGLNDPIDPDDSTWTHNNDWYSFAGLAFTWKMFYDVIGCPAYGDQNDKRRRR